MSINVDWWVVPLLVTVFCFWLAWFRTRHDSGFFSGVGLMFMLVPASLVSMLSWVVAGFCK